MEADLAAPAPAHDKMRKTHKKFQKEKVVPDAEVQATALDEVEAPRRRDVDDKKKKTKQKKQSRDDDNDDDDDPKTTPPATKDSALTAPQQAINVEDQIRGDDEGPLPEMQPPENKGTNTTAHPHATSQRDGLPTWFTSPVTIDPDVQHTFAMDRCLAPHVVDALAKQGIRTLFPIQAAIIPVLVGGYSAGMHPGDVCVCAPTGSGKTLAYVLPILQCLQSRVVRRLRAVVVLPTRELAQQVKSVFDAYLPAINAHTRLPITVPSRC